MKDRNFHEPFKEVIPVAYSVSDVSQEQAIDLINTLPFNPLCAIFNFNYEAARETPARPSDRNGTTLSRSICFFYDPAQGIFTPKPGQYSTRRSCKLIRHKSVDTLIEQNTFGRLSFEMQDVASPRPFSLFRQEHLGHAFKAGYFCLQGSIHFLQDEACGGRIYFSAPSQNPNSGRIEITFAEESELSGKPAIEHWLSHIKN